MTTIWKEVEIDIEPEDFSDDELMEELSNRKLFPQAQMAAREMFDAFKIGDEKKAIEIARKFAQDATGGILP